MGEDLVDDDGMDDHDLDHLVQVLLKNAHSGDKMNELQTLLQVDFLLMICCISAIWIFDIFTSYFSRISSMCKKANSILPLQYKSTSK